MSTIRWRNMVLGRSIPLKIGDKVVTYQKERGIIIKPWGREDKIYDWWVEIHFKSKGKEYQSEIPYKECELTVIDE